MKYIYHVHAIYQKSATEVQHFDGLICATLPTDNATKYQEMKRHLAAEMGIPAEMAEKVIIMSLSFLHKEG